MYEGWGPVTGALSGAGGAGRGAGAIVTRESAVLKCGGGGGGIL